MARPQDITVEDGNLVIRIPMKARRYNPYMDEAYMGPEGSNGDAGEMDNIVGVIEGDECNFAHWIDMDYKDKGDQISTPFFTSYIDKDEFRALCEKLGIEVVEYPICAYCEKPILGSFTYGEKGNMCFSCELAKEK